MVRGYGMLSILLLATFTRVFSTPIHDNTIGVTECQDCLADLYPQLTYQSTSGNQQPVENDAIEICKTNVNLLNGCLNRCRPSDPMAIVSYLRMIFISQNQNGCHNRTLNAQNCETIHTCLYEASNTPCLLMEQGVKLPLNCDGDARNAARLCYENLAAQGCSNAGLLSHVINAGLEEHCNLSGCIYQPTNYIYRTVASSNCTQYTLRGTDGTIAGPLDVPLGTVMDTRPGFCHLNHDAESNNCFN